MKIDYSIIIPAYNEEKRIQKTLDSYMKYFKSKKSRFEIIVVCDGCIDKTAEISRQTGRKLGNIKVLEFEKRLGKGGGILKGFEKAAGDCVGFTDADCSVGPEDFYSMLQMCEKYPGRCAVIGSRNLSNSIIFRKAPFHRQLLSKIFSFYINTLFGVSISDTQCGAKVMKKILVKDVLKSVKSRGFEFDAEMLWRIKKSGGDIEEFPVKWSHSSFSTFKIKSGPRMALNLLYIRLKG